MRKAGLHPGGSLKAEEEKREVSVNLISFTINCVVVMRKFAFFSRAAKRMSDRRMRNHPSWLTLIGSTPRLLKWIVRGRTIR